MKVMHQEIDGSNPSNDAITITQWLSNRILIDRMLVRLQLVNFAERQHFDSVYKLSLGMLLNAPDVESVQD